MVVSNKGETRMKQEDNVRMHMDFNRARILLSRIKTADDLIAIWKITGPCMESCPSNEKIQKRKNIS